MINRNEAIKIAVLFILFFILAFAFEMIVRSIFGETPINQLPNQIIMAILATSLVESLRAKNNPGKKYIILGLSVYLFARAMGMALYPFRLEYLNDLVILARAVGIIALLVGIKKYYE